MKQAGVISVFFFVATISQTSLAFDEEKQCKGNPAVTGTCYWARGSWNIAQGGNQVMMLTTGSTTRTVVASNRWAAPQKFRNVVGDNGLNEYVIGEFFLCPLHSGYGNNKNHGILDFVCIEDVRDLSALGYDDEDVYDKLCAFQPESEICENLHH